MYQRNPARSIRPTTPRNQPLDAFIFVLCASCIIDIIQAARNLQLWERPICELLPQRLSEARGCLRERFQLFDFAFRELPALLVDIGLFLLWIAAHDKPNNRQKLFLTD